MTFQDRLLRSNLRLRHLQLLVALDRTRHLGRTADALSVSAPAASKTLAEIERILGFQLFLRSTRGTEPTAHGQVVVDFARRVLADYARAQAELEAVTDGAVGRAHVGAITASIPAMLIPAIAAMKQEAPRSTVLIEEDDLKGLVRRLRNGELDFALTRLEPSYAAADLRMEPLYEDPSCFVVHPSSPLAGQNEVSLAELAAVSWVFPQPWATLRPRVEYMFRVAGLPLPSDLVETSSFLASLTILRLRGAVAMLPRSVASFFHGEGFLRILPMKPSFEVAPMGIVGMADRELSPTAAMLQKHIRSVGLGMPGTIAQG